MNNNIWGDEPKKKKKRRNDNFDAKDAAYLGLALIGTAVAVDILTD